MTENQNALQAIKAKYFLMPPCIRRIVTRLYNYNNFAWNEGKTIVKIY